MPAFSTQGSIPSTFYPQADLHRVSGGVPQRVPGYNLRSSPGREGLTAENKPGPWSRSGPGISWSWSWPRCRSRVPDPGPRWYRVPGYPGIRKPANTVHRYTGTQVHRYTGTQVHRYTGTQVHRYTGRCLLPPPPPPPLEGRIG